MVTEERASQAFSRMLCSCYSELLEWDARAHVPRAIRNSMEPFWNAHIPSGWGDQQEREGKEWRIPGLRAPLWRSKHKTSIGNGGFLHKHKNISSWRTGVQEEGFKVKQNAGDSAGLKRSHCVRPQHHHSKGGVWVCLCVCWGLVLVGVGERIQLYFLKSHPQV